MIVQVHEICQNSQKLLQVVLRSYVEDVLVKLVTGLAGLYEKLQINLARDAVGAVVIVQ